MKLLLGVMKSDGPTSRELSPTKQMHPFLARFSNRHRKLLDALSVYGQFNPDEILFHEGSPATGLFLIHKGKVALEADMNGSGLAQVQILHAGDALGLSWLFEPYIWRFHARALEHTVVTFYEGKRLRELYETNHEFGFQLLKNISELLLTRLQSTREQLMQLYVERSAI